MNQTPDFSQPAVPFSLRVGEDEFHAENLLRHLAGKRIVCAGRWRDRDVIAKIYIDPRRRRVHARREAEGARALQAHGIEAPALLCQDEDNNAAMLLFERIMPAEPALERWRAAQTPQQRTQTLRALVGTVAKLHQAGLLQEDLHLRNFLFAGDRLYTLDAGSLLIGKKPVAPARALDNLGLLFAQLDASHDALARILYAEYAQARQWPCGEDDLRKLQRAIERRRARRKHDHLSKLFRSSSAFLAHRDSRCFWVIDRGYDSPALRQMLEDPDVPLDNGARILKAGHSSTVGLVEVDGRALVIKRYNIKNSWHGLKRALRPSRAAISWRNAHALLLAGLSTPRPVALLQKKRGPLKQTAYFICEYLDAPDCYYLLHGKTLNEAQQKDIVARMCGLFDDFARLSIGHGDTKATNFLVGEAAISIIDLDALREYQNTRRAALAHQQDIQRFLLNWNDLPALKLQFEQGLRRGRRA
jgi:tRNA A-37 threonylcarbamoyl transferase component Bud32